MTPRDAADDPTRRHDLIRLLEHLAREERDRPAPVPGLLAGPTAAQYAEALGIHLRPTLRRLGR